MAFQNLKAMLQPRCGGWFGVMLLAAEPAWAAGEKIGGFALSTLVIVAIAAVIATAVRRALYSRFTNGDLEISLLGLGAVSLLEALLFLLAVQVAVEFSPWREPVSLLAAGSVLAALLALLPNGLLLWPARVDLGRIVLSTAVFPLSFWGLTAALFVPLYFYFMGL